MAESVFKLGVLKIGCIGTAPLLDLLLDERADRDDLEVRGFTSGAKLDTESCDAALQSLLAYRPDLALIVSPNAALAGPAAVRKALAEKTVPTITLADGPSKRAFQKKDDAGKTVVNVIEGQGFLVFPFDPMIGARREFLDPTEMVLFNADVIRVLAATGATRLVQHELNRTVESLREGHGSYRPKLMLTAAMAVEAGGFSNPYAVAKALAALQIAESVAGVTTNACFKEHDPAKYIPLAAAGHEMIRAAAKLADEAREIEKYNDSVLRTPHGSMGQGLTKKTLFEKPA